MASTNTVYILYDSTNETWGVYNNDIFLKNMFDTLNQIYKDRKFYVKEMHMNTNICKTLFKEVGFKNNKIIPCEQDTSNKYISSNPNNFNNKSMQREIKKIENLYEKFQEDKSTYDKIQDKDSIPEFFVKVYNLISIIKEKDIPEEEQFSYFVDNYYLKNEL